MAGLIEVEYVTSTKGTQQVLYEGYLHNKNRTTQTSVHWKCVIRTCKGRVTTVGNYIRNSSPHAHPPEDSSSIRFMSNIRKRAREETTPMPTLYREELSRQNPENVANVPSFSSVSSALYRHRRHSIPHLPETRSNVVLEGPWTETCDGRPFLLFDDGEDDKILAFCSIDQLRALQSADILYMDGTFSTCPTLWNQLYIIHARTGTCTYPLVFALLPDRQTATYRRLFSKLKAAVEELLNLRLAPVTVQTDFEQAAIRALQHEFPESEVKGCFFHFTQALWRKIQDLGLAVPYKEDDSVKTWARRAAGLPLLPAADVQDVWVDVMEETPDIHGAELFNDYMVTTWVDTDARFPISLWNHHDTAGPRTNNNLEGFHHKLNRALPHRHPNIYRFIELIKNIEKTEAAKLIQIDLGAAPPPRKRVYKECENRYSRLKDHLLDGSKTHIEFLDAVGNLLKLS